MVMFRPFLPMSHNEWLWFKSRTGTMLCEDTAGIVAYESDNGDILAACVGDNFSRYNCNVHIALDNRMVLRHRFLEQAFHWLFIQNGLNRVFGPITGNNERALRFVRHIGFEEVARVPHGAGEGVDTVVMEMKAENCQWLNQLEAA